VTLVIGNRQSVIGKRQSVISKAPPDGAAGWDEYAAFYDWENARTLGRRDVAFWRALARKTKGRVLELGAGTGRLTLPLARAIGRRLTGIDRSAPMLARAIAKRRRLPRAKRPAFLRGDIRALPFSDASLSLVIAPYGMLQSLTRERDLAQTLAEAARVLAPGSVLGIDLVPDLASWKEYTRSVRLTGPAAGGVKVTLIESVRQDRRRGLTVFDQEFVTARRGRREIQRFSLSFRTIPVAAMVSRLERAGFDVEHVFGDYARGPWHAQADVWLLLARRRC
jgi:ubiquinone/menaquinone biosynthesis C-methylase UbiE